VDGLTTPTRRQTQVRVRPKERSRNPLKNAVARDAEKAISAGTQT